MPLFKNHHNAPAGTTDPNYQAGAVNDPAYNAAGNDRAYNAGANDPAYSNGPGTTGYSNEAAYNGGPQPGAQPFGVGAPLDNSYGNQTTTTHHHGHPGAATAGGAAVGAGAGHELGGHAGPGAAVGGMAGNHASHQHNQAATGYNDGYADQPGAVNANTSHHPVRNDVGGAALGAETGHHLGGGHAGAGAAAGGLAGHEHARHSGTTHGTATQGTTTHGTTNAGGMNAKEAKSMEMKGKAQQLAGMILSSESMKAKGLAKEQEAAAIRHQGVNLQEAEHHETAARLARERAVGHGAHPDHGRLGGTTTH